MRKVAAWCGTRAIYGDMVTSCKSIVANSDVAECFFIIEDDEFPEPLPDMVRTINMAGQGFFDADGPNMASPYTYMAMMRAALFHVLPDIPAVLSLDADTVAVRDCSGAWDIPLDGRYFAAVPEWHRSDNGLLYTNAGVTLYNLDALRDGKGDEIIDVLNRRRYTWMEQDVQNYLCQGHIAPMPREYNANYWTVGNDSVRPIIEHYAGIRAEEWRGMPAPREYRAMPWERVMELHGRHA